MPKVTIITPTHNRVDSLLRLVKAVEKQDFQDYEFIIIDDGKKELAPHFENPKIKLLHTNGNQGAAVARNLGLSNAKGKYIAFTDDDCQPKYDWLSDLYDYLEHHPTVSGCSGLVFPPDEWLAKIIWFMPMNDENTQLVLKKGEQVVDHVSCTNSMWRKEALNTLNGFDVKLKRAQDLDLGLRAVSKGYLLKAVPAGIVWHHYRTSILGFLKQSFVQGTGGGMLYKKNQNYFSYFRRLIILCYPSYLVACFFFPFLWLIPFIYCIWLPLTMVRKAGLILAFIAWPLFFLKYHFNLLGIWWGFIK